VSTWGSTRARADFNVSAINWRLIRAGNEPEPQLAETIPILDGQEEDGRWWADIESMPGVMAYGATREGAISAVRCLALRVAADCIEHGEEVPAPFSLVFSYA